MAGAGLRVTVLACREVARQAGIDYATFRRDHQATWMQKSWDGRGGGWDVTCRCGYETRTGGAIKTRVLEDHATHVLDALIEARDKKVEAAQ